MEHWLHLAPLMQTDHFLILDTVVRSVIDLGFECPLIIVQLDMHKHNPRPVTECWSSISKHWFNLPAFAVGEFLLYVRNNSELWYLLVTSTTALTTVGSRAANQYYILNLYQAPFSAMFQCRNTHNICETYSLNKQPLPFIICLEARRTTIFPRRDLLKYAQSHSIEITPT